MLVGWLFCTSCDLLFITFTNRFLFRRIYSSFAGSLYLKGSMMYQSDPKGVPLSLYCPVFCALLNLLHPFKSALHFHLMLMKNVSRPIWKIKVLNKTEKLNKWGIFYYKEEKKNGTKSSIFDNNMIWFHINGNILSLFYIHFDQVYCTYRSWMLSCLSVIKELLLGYLEREKRRLALFVPHQYPKHTPNIIMKSKWYLSAIISVCNSSTSILLLYHPSFNLVVALRNAE